LHVNNIDNNACWKIPNYSFEVFAFYKVKKFACKSLKGKGNKSGMRLIYIYFPTENKVILEEIYFKGYQINMDYGRADGYKQKCLAGRNSELY
jgi:hypothetical protein